MNKVLILSDDLEQVKVLQEYVVNSELSVNHCFIDSVDEVFHENLELQVNLIVIDIDFDLYRDGSILNKITNDILLKDVPKIVLSKNDNIERKIAIFDMGIDEFIVKPFSIPEFIAKIKNLLKKYKKFLGEKIIQVGDIKINLINQIIEVSGANLKLSSKEFDILRLFAENPNQIFSRKEILSAVWRNFQSINERTIDVHINRLRIALSKIKSNRSYIKTVRGAGYSLDITGSNFMSDGMFECINNYNCSSAQHGFGFCYDN